VGSQAGSQQRQQAVQAVDDLGAARDEVIAVIGEQAEGRGVGFECCNVEWDRSAGSQSCADRISRVRLATVAGGQHADAGSQLRRYIHDCLGVPQQPLRECAPQTGSILDGPAPVRPAGRPAPQRSVAGAGGRDAEVG
jgi:hypothetical protein